MFGSEGMIMTKQRKHSEQLGYRLREGAQIPTRPVTALEIMSAPEFAFGVADARAGRPYRPGYDSWSDTNERWNYERGRQWAQLAPRSVVLKRGGKVTAEAMRWYQKDIL
jgi:hypothetical protein